MDYILIFLKYFFVFLVCVFLLFFIISFIIKNSKNPKLDADWEMGQGKTAEIIFKKNQVEIKNLRDFNWAANNEIEKEKWINSTFRISDITGLQVGVSHFSAKSGIAHVFIVFQLNNQENIALSIESRREKTEKFGIIKGLLYDYELIYVLATEKDLLDIRKIRNEKVYLYPIKISPEKSQTLFTEIAQTINNLNTKPEFYHLFTANCTNLVADEVKKISNKKFPFIEKTFLPGNSARALFNMNLINTSQTDFSKMQKDFVVQFDK